MLFIPAVARVVAVSKGNLVFLGCVRWIARWTLAELSKLDPTMLVFVPTPTSEMWGEGHVGASR